MLAGWQTKGDRKSVKRRAFETESAFSFRRVKFIANYGMIDGFKMNPDLMRSASFWSHINKGKSCPIAFFSDGSGDSAQHRILGNRLPFLSPSPSLGGPHSKILTAPSDRAVNNSFVLFQFAIDKRAVCLFHFSILKLLLQKNKSWRIFRNHHCSRSFFIQTMNNPGSGNSFKFYPPERLFSRTGVFSFKFQRFTDIFHGRIIFNNPVSKSWFIGSAIRMRCQTSRFV